MALSFLRQTPPFKSYIPGPKKSNERPALKPSQQTYLELRLLSIPPFRCLPSLLTCSSSQRAYQHHYQQLLRFLFKYLLAFKGLLLAHISLTSQTSSLWCNSCAQKRNGEIPSREYDCGSRSQIAVQKHKCWDGKVLKLSTFLLEAKSWSLPHSFISNEWTLHESW